MLSHIHDALAVLLPVDCAGCGAPDRAVCAACRAELSAQPPIETVLANGLVVHSAARYDGAVRQLILALKESGRTDAARPLTAAVTPLLGAASELALVPQSGEAFRRRGYDPVRLLVPRHRRTRMPVLLVTRRTASQKSLDLEGRTDNRIGSMVATGDLRGRRFVIVDDVVTTGATLVEAARAIEAAGGTVDFSVTLAATPRRFERFQ